MSLTFVSEQLLATNKLSHQDLYKVLGQLAERRIDYADLYFQSSYHEARVIEDGIIKDGSYNIDQGVGVRAVSGEKTGFAYADQITLNALQQSALRRAASCVSRATGGRTPGRDRLPGAVPAARSAAKPAARRENRPAAPRRQGGACRRCTGAGSERQHHRRLRAGVGGGYRRHAGGGCSPTGAPLRQRAGGAGWQA